jgi:HAD superfamily hydrolase (TIGR01484 family)
MQNISIARKTEPENSKVLNEKHLNAWVNAYRVFKNSFNKVHFDTIVFDYDGTLCDPSERFVGVSNDIAIELIRLLEAGIIVGIATGRGKSVRADLQRVIPKNFWENIFIGYYNGGEVSHLLDSNCPNNLISLDSKLSLIQEALSQNYEIQELAVFETRPKQISITPKNPINWLRVRKIVLEISGRLNIAGIKVVESSHSIDVLAENVSKLNLVLTCKNEAIKIGRLGQVLCIGDRGDFVGNDFEMLSTPYSLSVHLVSADPISCWNFSPPGYRGVQSTLYYLKKMKASNKQFNIKFGN